MIIKFDLNSKIKSKKDKIPHAQEEGFSEEELLELEDEECEEHEKYEPLEEGFFVLFSYDLKCYE